MEVFDTSDFKYKFLGKCWITFNLVKIKLLLILHNLNETKAEISFAVIKTVKFNVKIYFYELYTISQSTVLWLLQHTFPAKSSHCKTSSIVLL